LLAAGAQAAVVSLWPVDDLATSLFMGEFYRRLRAGADAINALKSAQEFLRTLPEAHREAALAEVLARAPASARRARSLRHFCPEEPGPGHRQLQPSLLLGPVRADRRGWSGPHHRTGERQRNAPQCQIGRGFAGETAFGSRKMRFSCRETMIFHGRIKIFCRG